MSGAIIEDAEAIEEGFINAANTDEQRRALLQAVLLVAESIDDLRRELVETNKHLNGMETSLFRRRTKT